MSEKKNWEEQIEREDENLRKKSERLIEEFIDSKWEWRIGRSDQINSSNPNSYLQKNLVCEFLSNILFFAVNGKWRYHRDCAYLGEPGIGGDERYCLMRTGSYNIFVEICTCVGRDGCNSAPSLQVHTVILFIGSLLCAFHLR